MSIYVAAKRYARGLGAALPDANAVDVASKQLRAFADVYTANETLRTVLESPAIVPREREQTLQNVCEFMEIGKEVQKALLLILRRGRLWIVNDIAAALERYADERANRTTAHATSATELTDDQQEKLKRGLATFAGKDVSLFTCVDPEIGGGVVVEIDGKILDGSLRTRLRQLKESILEEGSSLQ